MTGLLLIIIGIQALFHITLYAQLADREERLRQLTAEKPGPVRYPDCGPQDLILPGEEEKA